MCMASLLASTLVLLSAATVSSTLYGIAVCCIQHSTTAVTLAPHVFCVLLTLEESCCVMYLATSCTP